MATAITPLTDDRDNPLTFGTGLGLPPPPPPDTEDEFDSPRVIVSRGLPPPSRIMTFISQSDSRVPIGSQAGADAYGTLEESTDMNLQVTLTPPKVSGANEPLLAAGDGNDDDEAGDGMGESGAFVRKKISTKNTIQLQYEYAMDTFNYRYKVNKNVAWFKSDREIKETIPLDIAAMRDFEISLLDSTLDAIRVTQFEKMTIHFHGKMSTTQNAEHLCTGDILFREDTKIYTWPDPRPFYWMKARVIECQNGIHDDWSGYIQAQSVMREDMSVLRRILKHFIINFFTLNGWLLVAIMTIVLNIDTYSKHNNLIYFRISVLLLIVPLLCVSIYVCYLLRSKMHKIHLNILPIWVYYIPFINVYAWLTIPNYSIYNSCFSLALFIMITIAQFVIHLIYLICGDFIHSPSAVQWSHIVVCVIIIVVTPCAHFILLVCRKYDKYGLVLSMKDKRKIASLIFSLLFPLVLCEMIHCLPMLIYTANNDYNHSNRMHLWIGLSIFNGMKLLFVIHMTKRVIMSGGLCQYGGSWHPILNSVIVISFFSAPLLPYLFVFFIKYHYYPNLRRSIIGMSALSRNRRRKDTIFHLGYFSPQSAYYWILICYLWVAYGSQTIILLIDADFEPFHDWSAFIALLCCIVALVCICFVTFAMHKLFYAIIHIIPLRLL